MFNNHDERIARELDKLSYYEKSEIADLLEVKNNISSGPGTEALGVACCLIFNSVCSVISFIGNKICN